MAIRKQSYRRKCRSRSAKRARSLRMNTLIHKINDKNENVLEDYVKFLSNLDTKAQFCKFSNKVKPFNAQWNALRRKRVTASKFKKIVKWTKKTNYIYKFKFKYISDMKKCRGRQIEDLVAAYLIENGFNVKHINELWIHKHLRSFCCTSDGVIFNDNNLETFVEIKSYSKDPFVSNILSRNIDNISINPESSEYYQIQMVAEIIDVAYGIFIWVFDDKANFIIVERNLDFLWNHFDKVKHKYFRYIVPHIIYGPLKLSKKSQNQLL